MEKKLWAIWKSLNHWMIFFLFLTASHVQAQNDISDCDLDLLKIHPVSKCIQRFEQKLASLNQNEIKKGEDEFKRLEKENNIMDSIYYGSLFKFYPHPKVLFSQLKLNIAISKESPNNKIGIDCMECTGILQHHLHLTEYEIVIGMLENKKQLDITEQHMLSQSKHYAQCLRSVLDDLYNHPDKVITNKDITEQCYS